MNEFETTNEQLSSSGGIFDPKWLGIGFVLPCISPTFYYLATKRKVISVVIFFFLFGLVISGLLTISAGRFMLSISEDIRHGFESGDFPEIEIEDGVATVRGAQPFVLFDEEGRFIAVDTTGVYQEIDRSRYYQGILLTRTNLHVLNRGEYEEVPLSELHPVFDANPIIIDAESATRIWGYVAWIIIGVVFLGLAIWYILIRLTYLLLLGLVVWGITSLIHSNTGFGSVLITGLYATVPATFGHYLLGQFNVRFFGLYTLLLLSAWAIGLVAALGERDGGLLRSERSLRGWRALIGMPMLIVFALDVMFSWTNGAIIIGSIALITFIILGVVSRKVSEGPTEIQIANGASPKTIGRGDNDPV